MTEEYPPPPREVPVVPEPTSVWALGAGLLVALECLATLYLFGYAIHAAAAPFPGVGGSVGPGFAVRHDYLRLLAFLIALLAVAVTLGIAAVSLLRGKVARLLARSVLLCQPLLVLIYAEAVFVQVLNPLPVSYSRVAPSTPSKIVAGVIAVLAVALGSVIAIRTHQRWGGGVRASYLASAVLVVLCVGGILAASPAHDPDAWWIPTVLDSPMGTGFASVWTAPTGLPQASTSVACTGDGTCIAFGWRVELYPREVDSIASQSGQNWNAHVFGPTGVAGTIFDWIACPGARTCYLLADDASALFVSHDDGQTWHSTARFTNRSYSLEYGLSCPTPTTCYLPVLNQGIVVKTTDGGHSWKTSVVLGPDRQLTYEEVLCPTALVCYVSGYTGGNSKSILVVTSDGGHHWVRHSIPRFSEVLACDGPLRCIFGGNLLTVDGGKQFRQLHLPLGGRLASVVCPATSICYGIDESQNAAAVVKSIDGAATWRRILSLAVEPRNGGELLQLACRSATSCIVSDSSYNGNGKLLFYETYDAGRLWKETPFPAVSLQEIPGPVEVVSEFDQHFYEYY